MHKFLLIGGALLTGYAGYGQGFPTHNYSPPVLPVPMRNPADTFRFREQENPDYRAGAGSFQLLDGSWHHARKLIFDGNSLVVKDSTSGRLRYTVSTLRQLEVKKDTLLVMHDLPGRAAAANKPEFVQLCLNRYGIRLMKFGQMYFLDRSNVSLQLLPSGKPQFKTAMLRILANCPTLRAKVEADAMGRNEVVEIIRNYADCAHSNPPTP